MRIYINLIVFCFLAFKAQFTFGQNDSMIKHFLTVENGLSHNEVTSIVQDNDGFIWVGTRGGLNRFDGYQFKVYNQIPGDSNSLVNPSVEELFIDSKGNIWIGTKSGGVSKYNTSNGQFTNIVDDYKNPNKKISVNRTISFYEDKDGRIWIGTWGSGLYIYDELNNTTKHLFGTKKINSIVGTNDSRIFIGSRDIEGYGLFEYNSKTDSLISRLQINCRKIIYDEPRNVLWIVGGDNLGAGFNNIGLTKFDLRNNKSINYFYEAQDQSTNEALPDSYYEIHLDHYGKVWLGTWGSGLYLFNPEDQSFNRYLIYPQKKLNLNRDYDAILSIYEDKDNNIWLGTNGGGVCMLSAKLGFNTVGYNPVANKGLKNTRIMTVLEDSKERLWLGTIGDGLFWSPDKVNYHQVKNNFKNNKDRFFVIKRIYEDKDGVIWAGTNLGVFIVDIKDGNPSLVKADDIFKEFNQRITAVSFLEADGMFWVGTLLNGLLLYDDDKSKIVRHISSAGHVDNALQNKRISYLFEDSRENIWVGTYNGLHVYNKVDTTVRVAQDFLNIKGEFTGNIITCIDEDTKGNIWVGTPNGINKISLESEGNLKVSYFNHNNGLSSNFIKGIAHDSKGNIWFSTSKGVSKYASKGNRFINFDETDGVLGRNFTEASVDVNRKGEIYFGGTHGLTYFHPDEIEEYKLAFKPVFTSLSILNNRIEIGKKYDNRIILNKSITETKEIVLPYRQNKFEIRFSALDYTSRKKNKYKFFLENYDEDWVDLSWRRFIILNNLEPGDYTLKVKCANRHNVWNDEPATINIKILPPFWRTWYALLLYILFALGIVTVIRWNAVKQVRLANNLELEKVQHEQDQRISEMKMRFFTNISHEFRTPLTLILAPLKEIASRKNHYQINDELAHKIELVQNNSQRLMKLVNQLIDFRKLESGKMSLHASFNNLNNFVSELCRPFYELAEINKVDFGIRSFLNTKEIWFDKDKLEIILNNLISNSFKYINENGKIEVSLFEEEEEILISVSDNGPGIPAGEIELIFERYYQIEKTGLSNGSGIGLALTKKMVELHKGTISVTSDPHANTEFIVTLPIGNSHLIPEEMYDDKSKVGIQVSQEGGFSNLISIKSTKKVKSKSDSRILLVDDNLDIISYITELLEPYFVIQTASNGMEGLKMVNENKPNLIISDVMMPQMDGLEFCEKIRANEETANIPLIFLTAKNDEHSRLIGTMAGAIDYIYKPFDPILLVEKVKSTLQRHHNLKKQYSKSIIFEPSNTELSSGEEEFIAKVYKTIESNLNNYQFSSEVLASEFNRSYSSFNRKLKKQTGLSTAELIRSIRIKRAAQLLVDKDKNISEIAYEVGFNDVKHFRSVFQKQLKCSPSKYRENL